MGDFDLKGDLKGDLVLERDLDLDLLEGPGDLKLLREDLA